MTRTQQSHPRKIKFDIVRFVINRGQKMLKKPQICRNIEINSRMIQNGPEWLKYVRLKWYLPTSPKSLGF